MFELVDERFVFMVAQAPFDAAKRDSSWETNTFCSLRPLMTLDGEEADPSEFPNCGLVWWMVRPASSGFAEPGRLVVATLQRAVRIDERDPYSMVYQAEVNSIEPVRSSVGCELITVPSHIAGNVDDLVNSRDVIRVDHAPTSTVYLRFRQLVYGPFKASATLLEEGTAYGITVTPETADTVFEIADDSFRSSYGKYLRAVQASITDEPENPSRPNVGIRTVAVEFVLREGLDALKRSAHSTIKITSDEAALKSLARDVLPTRKARQEFNRLAEDVLTTAQARGEAALRTEPVVRILERQKSDLAAIESVAEAIIKSGLLDNALQTLFERARAEYIEKNATALMSEIQARVENEGRRLAELKQRNDAEESAIEAHRNQKYAEIEVELESYRRDANADVERKRKELEKLQYQLESQRETIVKQLSALVERFATGRGELIQDFLALSPLFEEIGFGAPKPTRDVGDHDLGGPPMSSATIDFRVPSLDENAPVIDEGEFFERFVKVVESQGFRYRRLDLVNFHVATKTNDITILGGYSGTGKSSLVDLYARALAGTTLPVSDRFVQVWVSPSWLDTKDLLGHVNALSRTFQPSESRVFEYVIRAQAEAELRGANSGVYVISLDEMNLAQVEHYFGAFLQALPSASREVPVFDRRSIDAASPFEKYAVLKLSPALRFVGTVNFDETTRQLSARLLDRADLIRLSPPEMAEMTRSGDRSTEGTELGPTVRLKDLKAWTSRESALRQELAAALDELRPHLDALGCPLTPRRYQAIRRFVASASPLCSQHEAFDLQVANRVIPQIRNTMTASARRAINDVRDVLERHHFEQALQLLDRSVVDLLTDASA